MSPVFLVVISLIFLNGCVGNENPTYKAAVVEVNPLSNGDTTESVAEITKQLTDIIESNELEGVDIVVLPETILNSLNTASLLPNTNTTYCDDPSVDHVLRSISCAVRKANKYVVIDLYVKVSCSLDDQEFCANEIDSTNTYNMAIVFDRNGDVIAKYRKYNLFKETGTQQTKTPDLVTFKTDFNVTFGVCICFDLMFDEPAIKLVDQGVKHFVYPTMWFSQLPYLTAVQYQQSWAYANNVTLLAANANGPSMKMSGSGIYSGRLGALEVFVSEVPATKILIANVPIDPQPAEHYSPNINQAMAENSLETRSVSSEEANSKESGFDHLKNAIFKEDLTEFTVKFLDFAENSNQTGVVCNKDICCNYDIEVSDDGDVKGKSSYSYAISVFSGHRYFPTLETLFTGQEVCSLIACTKMNKKHSCGIRTPLSQVHNRFNFRKLSLDMELPVTHMKVMPNTLTEDLLPLNATEFEYEISEIEDRYKVELNLSVPKSNLLTFAIFSRNYDKDMITNVPFLDKVKRIYSMVRFFTSTITNWSYSVVSNL